MAPFNNSNWNRQPAGMTPIRRQAGGILDLVLSSSLGVYVHWEQTTAFEKFSNALVGATPVFTPNDRGWTVTNNDEITNAGANLTGRIVSQFVLGAYDVNAAPDPTVHMRLQVKDNTTVMETHVHESLQIADTEFYAPDNLDETFGPIALNDVDRFCFNMLLDAGTNNYAANTIIGDVWIIADTAA